MALIPCGECGRDVSDKGATCPQCGAPIIITPPADGAHGVIRTKTPSHRPLGRGVEAIGTLLLCLAAVSCGLASTGYSQAEGPAILLFAVGFVVFIVGRFL